MRGGGTPGRAQLDALLEGSLRPIPHEGICSQQLEWDGGVLGRGGQVPRCGEVGSGSTAASKGDGHGGERGSMERLRPSGLVER